MRKKQVIRLSESQLRRIVNESVRMVLSEETSEGTAKQNAFLRKLMGSRYDDSYDNLSVRDTSAMIDAELNKKNGNQGSAGPRMATPRQIEFLMSNKYHKLPWASKIADRLTFQDASELCDAVSAYKGRVNAGGWSIRTPKEVWIPSCAETTSAMAAKYGLMDDAAAEKAWADDFVAAEQRKKDRKAEKNRKAEAERMKAELANADIAFVSTEDDERRNMFGRMEKGPGSVLYNIYMHGDVEDAIGWDIPTVVKGYEDALSKAVEIAEERRGQGWLRTSARVEGYDKPCYMYLWFGRSQVKPNGCVAGLIVDKSDLESIQYAKKCAQSMKCDI